MADSELHPNSNPPPPIKRGNRLLRWLGFGFVGIAILILFYGGIALYAWQQGVSEREAQVVADREAGVVRQLELAREDITVGRYELAVLRTQYILDDDPNNAEAIALQNEANSKWAILLTPSPTMTSTPLPPTVTPTPTITPSPTFDVSNLDREIDAIMDHVANQEWETAVTKLEMFRIAHPEHEPRQTAQLLYDSYIGLGLRLTRSDKGQIERGVFYLGQAQTLGTLSEEVAGELFWAEQYLEGIVYYDISWEAYLSYFRPMCQYASLFQNSCGKLADGLLSYGEQLTSVLDWCPAVDVYIEAAPHLSRMEGNDTAVAEYDLRLRTAQDMCASATPTPGPFGVITNTVPITTNNGNTGGSGVIIGTLTPTPSVGSQGAIPAGLATPTPFDD